jgi:uncharacterized protein
MRVNIDEIKEGGLERAWDLTRETVDEMVRGDAAGYRARRQAHVEAKLEKVDRRVLLEAHGRFGLAAPCGRCLQPTEVEVPVDFELTFVPREEARPEPGGDEREDRPRVRTSASFEPQAVDEETYAGKTLDLDSVLREQLLLAVPGYPVCGEGCKGLCPVCGTNLNERDCHCERRTPDPRWAGLEKLKQKKS